MVREARFAWDTHRPVPHELSRRDWDCDDPSTDPERSPSRRRSRKKRERDTAAEPDADSHS